MSTRDVERELTALLHRHAEDAMDITDTQAERERFFETLEVEPPPDRRRWVVGVAAAAAAIAVGLWWAAGLGDDTDPRPAQAPDSSHLEREAELLADRVVAAYANHDADAVAALLSTGEKAWPSLRLEVPRNEAWQVEYDVEACSARSVTSIGIMVGCDTDLHLMYSDEVGEGPFHDSVFWIFVQDGEITSGEVNYPWQTNGMGDYTARVFDWVETNYPRDAAFLDLDEPDVPRAQWERWLRLWEKRLAAYHDAMTPGS